MKSWIIAAAACLPALALATPITMANPGASAKAGASSKADKAKPGKHGTTPANNSNNAGNGGGAIGAALASNVTLNGLGASALVYSAGVNPQQGPGGNSSGFAGAWSGSQWDGFAKFSGADSASLSALSGLQVSTAFAQTSGHSGTWSITNGDLANNLALDLVFAMHVGGGSGSWLFDNLVLDAGATLQGTWALNLLNNGGSVADYSNLTLFARDAQATALRFVDAPPPLTEAPPAPPVLLPVIDTPAEPSPSAPGIPELLEELNGHSALEPVRDSTPLDPAHGAQAEAEVPEPGTLALALTGLLLFGAGAPKRRAPAQ